MMILPEQAREALAMLAVMLGSSQELGGPMLAWIASSPSKAPLDARRMLNAMGAFVCPMATVVILETGCVERFVATMVMLVFLALV
jgi:hypothetical protein